MIRPATLACALALACSPAADRADGGEAPADELARVDSGAAADVVAARVAIFLLADSAALEAARARHSADDFAVVADDMMWYRAEAWSFLEQRGIPIVSHQGRRTLRFRVGGTAQEFDFAAEPTLDLVVLYDVDRAPQAVAPVDVPAAAATYYGELPVPAGAGAQTPDGTPSAPTAGDFERR